MTEQTVGVFVLRQQRKQIKLLETFSDYAYRKWGPAPKEPDAWERAYAEWLTTPEAQALMK